MAVGHVLSVVVMFLHVVNVNTVCQDLDTTACQLMHSHDPNLCLNLALSEYACERYCKLCPLTCFHCDVIVHNHADCNTTKVCDKSEKCLIAEATSPIDGRTEYKMNCASDQVCFEEGLSFFGKREINTRDISAKCCSGDLCNTPIFQTMPSMATTTPKPMTSTIQPTTSTTQPTTSTTQLYGLFGSCATDNDCTHMGYCHTHYHWRCRHSVCACTISGR